MLPETKEIGYISKTHGYKGDVLLNVYEGYELDIEEGDFLFLIHNDKPVPYLITKLGEHKSGCIVKFETNPTEDLAKQLVGTTVHLDTDRIALDEGFIDYSVLVDFRVIDHQKGDIGLITEVIDNGPNVVLQIECDGKEIMLPYNEELIQRMDESNKVLYYEAPEGLIDMYLE